MTLPERAERSVTVVVPVKRLARAKSRLAPVIGVGERRALAIALLRRTIDIARAATIAPTLLVVTADPEVSATAANLGVEVLPEVGSTYVAAVEQARQHLRETRPEGTILAVAADLPLLTAQDLEALAASVRDDRTVVLAPDRWDIGTNAVGLATRTELPFCFGPESFSRFLGEVQERGLTAEVYRAVGTAFDLDEPTDLDALRELAAQSRSDELPAVGGIAESVATP